MRKYYRVLLYASLCCLIFTGCQRKEEPDEKEPAKRYTVSIGSHPDLDAFSFDGFRVDPAEPQEFTSAAALQTRQAVLGAESKTLSYAHSSTLSMRDYASDVYTDAAGDDRVYVFKANTNALLQIYSGAGTPVIGNSEPLRTEQDFRNAAESALAGYSDANLADLQYACTTRLIRNTENGIEQYNANTFQTAAGPEERVSSYTFTYTKYVGGYPTTDRAMVMTDASGNIMLLQWNPNDFASVSSFALDPALLTQAIEDTLSATLDTKQYALTAYDTVGTILFIEDGKPQAAVSLEIQLKDRSSAEAVKVRLTLHIDPSAT